jgi:hypothetical protein
MRRVAKMCFPKYHQQKRKIKRGRFWQLKYYYECLIYNNKMIARKVLLLPRYDVREAPQKHRSYYLGMCYRDEQHNESNINMQFSFRK